jgi:hypothetical protein
LAISLPDQARRYLAILLWIAMAGRRRPDDPPASSRIVD